MDLENVDEVWENLRSHRVQVVQELRVDRTLLFDYLRSKAIFDSEDCELVQAEKTNERKASKLLDILQTKGTESLVHFLDVVQLLNPGIYEKLTGQKATTRVNPIFKTFTDLDPQRADLDLLSDHLRRAIADLQEMTLRYDQLLKENQQLSKKLAKVNGDLDLKSKLLQTTEDQVMKAEERAREAWNNAAKVEEAANLQRRESETSTSDRHAYLLALLMKLVSSEEEAKQLRKQLEEANRRNEDLMRNKLREFAKNFDHHSKELSKTLSRQRNNLKTVEDLKDRNQELEFISQKLQIEKDQATSELNELKDCAEALKAHYDALEKNKQQYQQNYDIVVVDCSQFRKQIQELQFQLSFSQRQEANVRAQNDKLTQQVKKYQEQRDLYGEERIKAITERDDARKERDVMYQHCSDARKDKDEALERFLEETKEFERRHETDIAEIQALRERLIRAEEELRCLQDRQVSSKIEPLSPERNNADDVDHEDENDDFYSIYEAVLNQKSRNSTEIVNSIKKRLSKTAHRPGADSEIVFAQWLSRMPCQALIPILCQSAQNTSGDMYPAANVHNFDLLPSSSARDSGAPSCCNSIITDDLSEAEHLQEQCLHERKDESVSSPFNIDGSITPEPRRRAHAIDRSRTPVAGAFNFHTL